MSSSSTLPAQTPAPAPLNFDHIAGHQIHDTSTMSAAKDESPITGIDPGSLAEDFIPTLDKLTSHIENYTQEGREQHPVLARLGDATRAAKELLVGGTTPMGPQEGVANNPVTTAMSMGDAAPEVGEALEAGAKKAGDYLADSPAFHPNPEHGGVPMGGGQGGHAGGGVASVEELNRPGRFVKVSRSGQLTDQGKVPDFNLKPGEAGYQVTPQGYELKAGQETPATKLGVDKYHKEVFKPSVKTTQGPPVENAGIIQNARKILRDPASTEEDKAIATRQLEHQHETQFESNEPAKSEITYRTDNNGTRWAKTPDSPAEVSVPKDMKDADVEKYAKEKLDLQKDFAKSRAIPESGKTTSLEGSTVKTMPSGVRVKTGSSANSQTIREVEKRLVDTGRIKPEDVSRLRKAAMDQYDAQGRPANLFEDFYAQKLRQYNSVPSLAAKALAKD